MDKTIPFTLTMIALILVLRCDRATAQDRAFELSGHFMLLSTSPPGESETVINCITSPCPTPPAIKQDPVTEPGLGGRFGYNVARHVAVEAESSILPRNRIAGAGRRVQGLFGVKAGRRGENIGLFAKARPGFIRVSNGDLRQPPNTACIAVFPTPLECYEAIPRTFFAADLGGVVEIYVSKRAVIRLEGGDLIVRSGERNVATATLQADDSAIVVHAPAETTHAFQASVGVGFRF